MCKQTGRGDQGLRPCVAVGSHWLDLSCNFWLLWLGLNFTAAKADLTWGLLLPQHQLCLPLPLLELVSVFVQMCKRAK